MPLFSLYTPSHDGTFLANLWRSLQAQTLQDFEWVVAPNGKEIQDITAQLRSFNDGRIKVHPYFPSIASNIRPAVGALKKFACDRCEGELLFEMDHDDWLTPNCLAVVAEAWNKSGAGFLFTESIGLCPGDISAVYDAVYGWRKGIYEYNGKPLPVMLNFDISPRSLSMIWWAPNHARVWHRDAYRKAGGYDPDMILADDHDLLCRTYLAGVAFEPIREVLYLQRRHENAVSIQRVREVERLSFEVRDRYLHQLVFEWCRREKLHMLDLGGRLDCPKDLGFKAVDVRADDAVDYHCEVMELDRLFPDHSVGCFRAFDFLEHIPIPNVIPLMNLLYRKLAPMGWIISSTPAVADADGRVGLGAYADPTHVSYWSPLNFRYFTNRRFARYCPDIDCRFQDVRIRLLYPDAWHRDQQIPYVQADLMAIKGDRIPGECKI